MPEYVIFCGEQRASFETQPICENYKKIIRINDKCVVGFTGDICAIRKLTSPILNFNLELPFEMPNARYDLVETNYGQIIGIMQNYFENLKAIQRLGYDIHIEGEGALITFGGIDNGVIRVDIFKIKNNCFEDHHLSFPPTPKAVICMGLTQHNENFNQNMSRYSEINIVNIQEAFEDTVMQGMDFDSTINDNLMYEIIEREHA